MLLTTVATPDGPFTLLVEDGQVLASGWTDDAGAIISRLPVAHRPAAVNTSDADDAATAFAVAAVAAYYDGDLDAVLAVPVRHFGTDFQRQGWARLREVPAGEPLTYTGFAAALGQPTAVRAAAAICARNAPALFVPCHRVLRGDGSLGGFAWGTAVKAALLAREAENRALR